MANLDEILREAGDRLEEHGVADARREAASLLEFTLSRNKTFLYSHPEYELSNDEESRYRSFVERRAGREPFQYIVGRQEFCGLELEVTPDVLIPRPETEMLVERAVGILSGMDAPRFCEVGVGSGCIAVSILHQVQGVSAVGLEISPAALQVARRNAETNGVEDRLELRESDVFSALEGEKFDLVVSNPPYVRVADIGSLQPEVRDFEPHTSLTDGGDGVSIIRRIIEGAPDVLQPGGGVLIEIGFDQGYPVGKMFRPEIWDRIEIVPDFQGIPRMASARLK